MTRPKSVLSRELLPASIAIFTLVGLAAFESLGVAAALPELAADLGDVELLPWVITAYLLLSGVATVLAGALIDSLGVRLVFRVAVLVFVTGSVISALASAMPQLIAGRVVQGAGGGALVSVGLAAVTLLFPSHLIGRAFAANSTVWGVMGAAGPGIAALLLTFASWHWIFLVNVPLGLAALAAGWRVMPGPVGAPERASFDLLGVAGIFGLTCALLLAADQIGPWSLVWLAAAGAIGTWYIRRAQRIAEPVMKRRHLVEQPFGGLAASIALLLAGGIAASSFFTLYVRGARGAGEALTAWSVVFFVVGWTAGANLSSRLLDRMAETSVMATGFGFTIIGLSSTMGASLLGLSLGVVFVTMFAAGMGIGMATNAGLTLLQASATASESGRATSAHQFYRNMGFTVGAAIGGAVILFVVGQAIGDLEQVRALLAGGEGAQDAADAIARGFSTAAAVGTVLALGGLIPFRRLRRHLAPARAAANEHRRSHVRYTP